MTTITVEQNKHHQGAVLNIVEHSMLWKGWAVVKILQREYLLCVWHSA